VKEANNKGLDPITYCRKCLPMTLNKTVIILLMSDLLLSNINYPVIHQSNQIMDLIYDMSSNKTGTSCVKGAS